MYIVLLDGVDVRFLGGSARARNARVIERVDAALCALSALGSYGSHAAMLVPPHVAMNAALFADPAFDAAIRQQSPTWLEASANARVLVGSASALAELTRDPATLRALSAPDASNQLNNEPSGPASPAGPSQLSGLPRQRVGPDTIYCLTTPVARRRATRDALLATAKPTDGWVSRHLNRPLSRLISRGALSLGLTANAASGLTLAVGLACAWAAAHPGYRALVLTGVLFQLASVLDGVDGEIARATVTESPAGARLDSVVDQATYVGCLLGVLIGWSRDGVSMMVAGLTIVVVAALVVTLVRGARFVTRHGENASFVLIDRSVRRAARDTGHLPLRVAAGAFTALRRDLFALIFLGVALTGIRAAVPALIGGGIAIANVTFSAYGQELADAARAERRRPRVVPASS